MSFDAQRDRKETALALTRASRELKLARMLIITQKALEKKLIAHGNAAKAQVLAARGTINTITEGVNVAKRKWRLNLRVQPDGEPEFEVNYKQWLGGNAMPRAGQQIDVLFDPRDHSKVVVDPRVPDPVSVALQAAQAQSTSDGPNVFVLSRDGQLSRVGAPAAPAEYPIEQLQTLADLHARGALTDKEFASQKQRILGTP